MCTSSRSKVIPNPQERAVFYKTPYQICQACQHCQHYNHVFVDTLGHDDNTRASTMYSHSRPAPGKPHHNFRRALSENKQMMLHLIGVPCRKEEFRREKKSPHPPMRAVRSMGLAPKAHAIWRAGTNRSNETNPSHPLTISQGLCAWRVCVCVLFCPVRALGGDLSVKMRL